MITVVIGCDNAAVELKNILAECLRGQGAAVEDEGCMDSSDQTVYPLVAKHKTWGAGMRNRCWHVHDR